MWSSSDLNFHAAPLAYPTAFYEVEVAKIELGQSLNAILCKLNLSLFLCIVRALEEHALVVRACSCG